MQYKCENCRRRFEFDDFIEFCPYCGKMLDSSADMLRAPTGRFRSRSSNRLNLGRQGSPQI